MCKATAEVYRFSHGRWWRETFQIEPGDRIGSERALRALAEAGGPSEIDYGTGWFVLDIISDIDADKQTKDRGLGAAVLLQRLDNPEVTAFRKPKSEARDFGRERLKEAVELAELAAEQEDVDG